MKSKAYLLVALFWLVVGSLLGQGSWVDVTVQTDNYAGETSWEIIQNSEVVAVSPPLLNNTLQNHTVFLPPGEYNFVIYDSYGDGICCGFGEGWYSLTNNCGLELFDYEFGGAAATTFFELEPCLPILLGCMDETANNYNPWATIDDESCNVTGCPEGETFVSMELTLDTWPGETGFTVVNLATGQPYAQAFPGEFNFGDQLATYTYDFCVALGFELILTDTYGDGLNGSTSGGEDGACVITACGDSVLWELEDLAFEEFGGGTMYSGAVFTEPCPPVPPVVGCMDDDYVDYDPLAEVQGACETLHNWGCMDPGSFNYDSLATISDNNSPCAIEIMIEDDGGDGWGNSKLGMAQGDQLWLFTMGPGSFSESWTIDLDSDEEVYMYYFQQGNAQQSAQELAFQTLHNSVLVTNAAGDTLLSEGVNPFFNNGQGALQPFAAPEWNVYSFTPYCGDSCEPFTYGCTDDQAQNYNADVNTEDGSCYYQAGCTQAGYLEYYTQGYEADFDNGSCDVLAIFGCMDNEAYNYNPEANVDNEGCIAVVEGCTNPLAFNYLASANVDDGSCEPFIYGCTDPAAFNYNETANIDDGECEPFVYGCTDSVMFNYNPLANAEYDPSNCEPYIYGCTDPSMLNYNPEANTEDFSCIAYIYGCTDPLAFNYDPLANTENGSCIETVEGCADLEAWNYNAAVNIPDNETCLYEAVGCVTGLGEPGGDGYWLNDLCFAWVIEADPYCCTEEWDATCQSTYDYCSTTGIEAIIAGDDLVVYPNPVRDVLSINQNVDLDVFDSTGRIIVSETNTNAIDASLWAPGMYTVCIAFNNRVVVKRIIK